MGYSSKETNRAFERASKISHSAIINDPAVKSFLQQIKIPSVKGDISEDDFGTVTFESVSNSIKHYIAVDGGYSVTTVRTEYPSAQLAFIQYGANIFSKEDIEGLSSMPFVGPDDIAKLKEIERRKLVLPLKNVILKDSVSLIESVRRILFEHFVEEVDGESFIETLKWFLFEEYKTKAASSYDLSRCPYCDALSITIDKNSLKKYQLECSCCGVDLYLTDVFRLHEVIDEELGASGILGYLITLLEHFVIIHLIRIILKTKPTLLTDILFIKDGPLAFFGQTANMHKKMRTLCSYLLETHDLFLVGLEKSGGFVEHAAEIVDTIRNDQIILLSNEYIYRHIIPGQADPSRPYAGTSYYSSKFIYKSSEGKVYVATVPTASSDVVLNPQKKDFRNIDVIIANLNKLKCDMYDNSLVPIALVNKLVSLSVHPSTAILERFAKEGMKQ